MAGHFRKEDNLGKIHQEYNKLLKEAQSNPDAVEYREINYSEPDVNNLLIIDLACHNKNVEYILYVLKSNDMLYVSRAISKSTWMITDKQYEHIINPNYLQTELFPRMITKARIKLEKHIRLHLKDESRVESFYNKENNPKIALKWLLGCSVPFILKNIRSHETHISEHIIERFCEKSASIFEHFCTFYSKRKVLKSCKSIIPKLGECYLTLLEKVLHYELPELNDKATEYIMTHFYNRIIQNFDIYARAVHIKTFARCMPRDDIKLFLYKQAEEFKSSEAKIGLQTLFKSERIINFIKVMPLEDQFRFVKDIFIDKEHITAKELSTPELRQRKLMYDILKKDKYVWYQFAPFEIAFSEMKQLICDEPSAKNKNAMLLILIRTTGGNQDNIHTLLQYYKENHKNDSLASKDQFIAGLMNHINVQELYSTTWNILQEIFEAMEVYKKVCDEHQNFVIFIILYHVTHDLNVPRLIESKFKFTTLKTNVKLFNMENQTKVFYYLYNYLETKIENHQMTDQVNFEKGVEFLKNYLHLLADWEIDILEHSRVVNKIRQFIKIKQDNHWTTDLSALYNIKRSWRRHFFLESIALCPTGKVCVNALKHDPTLLLHNITDVESILSGDDMSTIHLLRLIRTYWADTFATEWANAFLESLNNSSNHRASIRGLCQLLTQNSFLNIIKKYAPKEDKINWSEIDENSLSLQRHIAKNMHQARPQPDVEEILLYTKQDYLQYALPSLFAIFYNMKPTVSSIYISKLLDSRVSLQKHVVRLAFTKLEPHELEQMLGSVWKTSKNNTIRCIIFNWTFDALCKLKDTKHIEQFWALLEMFIDNLTIEEDRKIYDKFISTYKLPRNIQAKFLEKAYNLLNSLTVSKADKKYFDNLKCHFRTHSLFVMELLCPQFAANLVQEYINTHFFKEEHHSDLSRPYCDMIKVMSAFFLTSKDSNIFTGRYENILKPLIQKCGDIWNDKRRGKYFIRDHLSALLISMLQGLKSLQDKIDIQLVNKLFLEIQSQLSFISISENYIMLTTWKFAVELSRLLAKTNFDEDWDKLCSKITPEFGDYCLSLLKTDVKTYFPCIYVLFAKAFGEVADDFLSDSAILEICESLLRDGDFVQSYLTVISIKPEYVKPENEKRYECLNKNILAHPSVEVKMHYYNQIEPCFGD